MLRPQSRPSPSLAHASALALLTGLFLVGGCEDDDPPGVVTTQDASSGSPDAAPLSDTSTADQTSAADAGAGLDGASETGADAATVTARLLVADPDQDKLYIYSLASSGGGADWRLTTTLDDVHVEDHAGFLPIDDGRVLFVESTRSELVALDTQAAAPGIVARAGVKTPAAHIAVDPRHRYAVASHGDGKGVGELTLVQLSDFAAKQVKIVTGEPGIALGGDPLRLYHRNDTPPQIEAYAFADLWSGMVPSPQVAAVGSAPHGEVIAHTAGKLIVAAGDGFNLVTLDGGTPGAKVVVPYDLDGRTGGRAFYARLSGDGKYAYTYLRNDGYDPATMMSWKWKDWESDAYVLDVEKATGKRIAIGKGLVYRLADSPRFALFVQYHPEGDFAHIMDTAVGSPTFQTIVAKIALDAMSKAPGPDGSPWESTAFRIAGMTPDGKWGFVSHGGDGLVSVLDLDARKVVAKINTPTKLNGGGYLLGVTPGARYADTIGR